MAALPAKVKHHDQIHIKWWIILPHSVLWWHSCRELLLLSKTYSPDQVISTLVEMVQARTFVPGESFAAKVQVASGKFDVISTQLIDTDVPAELPIVMIVAPSCFTRA
ncbi:MULTISPECIES: hypothetical protein [Rhizobium]|uniref:hypothetical protein n=1 Tax=Rhizobium TaxID=379 RepID=UPI00195862F1|nr:MULTISPECIES: hypothetical protein [Rhizobium]MBM7046490.1 hypothetical protein [Rhizobium lusitanum]